MSDETPPPSPSPPDDSSSVDPELSDSTEIELVESDADRDLAADRIVHSHVLWSIGAGLIPIPLADIAGVTAIQMDALKQLAENYGIDYREAKGKGFVTGLVGSTAARFGASAVKLIPGIGSVVGGLSMSALSGASTYAVCHVAINHFKTHGDFLELDLEDAKAGYQAALKKGKELVSKLSVKADDAQRIQKEIEELEALKNDGRLSEEDFERRKSNLLSELDASKKENGEDVND